MCLLQPAQEATRCRRSAAPLSAALTSVALTSVATSPSADLSSIVAPFSAALTRIALRAALICFVASPRAALTSTILPGSCANV